MELEERIRRRALELGFALCGFARLRPLEREAYVRSWVAEGRAGEMHYLERNLEKRLDPQLVLPGARSVVVLGWPYRAHVRPEAVPDWREKLLGRMASYALGPDYHDVVGRKLRELSGWLESQVPCRTRPYVDTGPVLEREWARLAGVGWIGKNTLVLDPSHGSWFFLGEILTDLPLEDSELQPDRCGGCRRCLDRCPTGALDEPYRMDARLCIAYLTIELRGPIPRELRPALENWVFGCDLCQEVCPWTREVPSAEGTWFLPELLLLDQEGFRIRFGRTAVRRAKREGLLRNAAVALGNTGNPDAVPVLTRALQSEPSALVRRHVAWALGRIPCAASRHALEACVRADPDPSVREEARAALEASP